MVYKEGTTETFEKKRKIKPNMVEEAITSTISAENKIDKVNKKEKSQTSKETVDTSKKINRIQLTQ